MEREKLDRINELSRLSKQRELTPEELEERASLRSEYISDWRSGVEGILENTYVIDKSGAKRKLRKK